MPAYVAPVPHDPGSPDVRCYIEWIPNFVPYPTRNSLKMAILAGLLKTRRWLKMRRFSSHVAHAKPPKTKNG